ncbi:Bifunctional aspartate aminotransferase [Phytophthora nicotianae]|uniref:Bifunctional aspartate aminotransferase n=1 Tax=Phytophthora nicotianae TaxID=4792 RepID=A0A0W8CNX3_PHYNI|nr:Bifunctional aspartate aminotransferase [Phytophthora nicotianae]
MVDLRIPDSQIKSALGPGKLDSLAVIPVDQIAKKEMMRVGVDVINRTNNPLEKYNRDFASRMSTHPGLLAFIEGTKREAARYIRRIEDIKHLRQTASQHAPPAKLEIPEDYESFE